MVTWTQYLKKHRQTKQFRSSTPHFEGSPFKYGTCVRIGVVKPKKPNSAQRKITKVCLSNGRYLIAYIPGFGHKLLKNNEVMIRGGRVPDLPGVRYHVMRAKKDFTMVESRTRSQRRSKYGVKDLNTQIERLKKKVEKAAKKKKKPKLILSQHPEIKKRLTNNFNLIKLRW
jgi:small subunit ribosomal protein S12